MVRLDMTSPPPWEHGIPPYWVLTPALPDASRSKNNTEQDNSECHTYIFQLTVNNIQPSICASFVYFLLFKLIFVRNEVLSYM
jgi:hypothetical protein